VSKSLFASLKSNFESVPNEINKLDKMLSSPNLSKLEKEGITLIREYLKKALIKSYLGNREKTIPMLIVHWKLL